MHKKDACPGVSGGGYQAIVAGMLNIVPHNLKFGYYCKPWFLVDFMGNFANIFNNCHKISGLHQMDRSLSLYPSMNYESHCFHVVAGLVHFLID
jgi:hypothetical protein